MKYFLDTEFLEGTQVPSFFLKNRIGKLIGAYQKPTIDLISIGIVAEDEREYYAISKDFNLKEAWNRYQWKHRRVSDTNTIKEKEYWIRENVLKPIFYDMLYLFNPVKHELHNISIKEFNYKNFKYLLSIYGKTNKQIAEEIKEFCIIKKYQSFTNKPLHCYDEDYPDFYAYYADYDWVVFCWLFGKMIDLPNGFPMYCNDLKQTLNERQLKRPLDTGIDILLNPYTLKNHPNYPKQENEHNALDDARWNKALCLFLENL